MKEFIKRYLDEHKEYFAEVSNYVFDHPETRFEEYESAAYLARECEKQGFQVERNVAGIETAFTAAYGSGKPVIGFLGEFDALSGLSQKPGATKYAPLENDVGHGCGHNLLGTGAFAAACAVKSYLEAENLPGTVIFFGCPGEEGGSGKTFMVRDGVFDDVDTALTWHPSPANAVMSRPTLANYQVFFRFKGTAAHAANSPHLGRSALDAVELMNVGVNYLREHIVDDARVHYAVTNSGGISPNVVQSNAEVLYLVRAAKVGEAGDILERVKDIARGAALMTGTELTIELDKACSNYIPNRTLEKILYQQLIEYGVDETAKEEESFAKDIWETFTKEEQSFYVDLMRGFGYAGDGSEFAGKYISDSISPYEASNELLHGSSDVSDVSWVVPTAQVTAATSVLGTPLHTWQMTTQGISSIANKGMLRAAGSMALTGLTLLKSEESLNEVKKEFRAFAENNPYTCPIPKEVKPSKLNE
ncbi:M20 family metallopeptidase [Oceanobacillus neutriphilus]|uniref:Peptidase M20 n=1 Tax=Oceanobacillus neutriphilus TaxID=531815 RepID=A0ABQ2NT59_9BACI|nr:M20 family metallopeptidase [Oceanobacillus neutriphilus]GGP10180.1 peptidase M20 [Oceanobacillus neutriphilus]